MRLDVISRHPDGTVRPTPLLFVHGSFADNRCWDDHFLPYFAERGYAAHALSLRGHGRSGGRAGLQLCRLSDYVDDVASVVEGLPAPPVLIGHSMGGMVVQKYLERDAAAAGVALMASVPPLGLLSTNLHMAMRHPFLFAQMGVLSVMGSACATPEVVRRLLFSPDMPASALRRYADRFQPESQLVALDMLGGDPLRLDPRALDMPFLVLGAADDVFVPPHLVRTTARHYGAEARVLPDMAHAMMLEANWRDAADALLEWLERAVAATSPAALPAARPARPRRVATRR